MTAAPACPGLSTPAQPGDQRSLEDWGEATKGGPPPPTPLDTTRGQKSHPPRDTSTLVATLPSPDTQLEKRRPPGWAPAASPGRTGGRAHTAGPEAFPLPKFRAPTSPSLTPTEGAVIAPHACRHTHGHVCERAPVRKHTHTRAPSPSPRRAFGTDPARLGSGSASHPLLGDLEEQLLAPHLQPSPQPQRRLSGPLSKRDRGVFARARGHTKASPAGPRFTAPRPGLGPPPSRRRPLAQEGREGGSQGAGAAAWPGEGARGRRFLRRLPGF